MKKIAALLTACLASIALTGCAGSIAKASRSGPGGEGFGFGAEQADVNSIVDRLEPTTITFQPSASSPKSIMADNGLSFKEYVEKRSHGRIKVDIVWGQAIAGYSEVHDALADGRVDVSYTLPGYLPTDYPAVNALGTAMSALPAAQPVSGELIANGSAAELGWNNEQVLEEYADRGLVTLHPFIASGGYYGICTDPLTSLADWKGKQVRIATASQGQVVTKMGASPVSLAFPETYEALQRGTVDCTLGQMLPSAESHIFDVAPNIAYTTKTSFSRTPGAYLAGLTYTKMPLAYQQIVFDAMGESAGRNIATVMKGTADSVRQSRAAKGTIEAMDDEAQTAIGESFKGLVQRDIERGTAAGDIRSTVDEVQAAWTARVKEMDVPDGDLATMDKWYDAEQANFQGYADAITSLPGWRSHRPS